MKEKLNNLMKQGGYVVIIATVAMALYIFVLQWGDDFFNSKMVEYKIEVDENGYLSTNYGGDTDDVYIIWETDGGSIKPVDTDEDLLLQYEEGNKWYFAYTNTVNKVMWSPEDADGNIYSNATIRATVYTAESDETWYVVYDYINDAEITVTKDNGITVEAEDRLFSNPVREGSDGNWSQIYEVNVETSPTKTLRYRFGYDVSEETDLILRWECEKAILCETKLTEGVLNNFTIDTTNSGKQAISQVLTITINPENMSNGMSLEAYLTRSGYSDYEYNQIASEDEMYKATYTK